MPMQQNYSVCQGTFMSLCYSLQLEMLKKARKQEIPSVSNRWLEHIPPYSVRVLVLQATSHKN